MNILVTGGSGFIGTVLVTDLLESCHNVSIYDKQRSDMYPDKCIIGDVRDRDALTQALRNIDAVYHLAAEHQDNVQPISLYYDVNVDGARNLVHACVENGVPRLIFTSSVALYGLNAQEPTGESPIKPFNDYGKSKYEAELIFDKWAAEDVSRSLTILRPAVIFGKDNRGNVYNLIKQIASGKFVMVGKGKNRKSMGYVLNISTFLAMKLNAKTGRSVYNE